MHDSISFYPGELAEAKNILKNEVMNEKMKMFFAMALVIFKIGDGETKEEELLNELYEQSPYSISSKETLKNEMEEAITTSGSSESFMEFIGQRADQMSYR